MTDTAQSHESEARQFYSGAQGRALRIGIVLSLLGAICAFWRWNTAIGLAFVIGALVGGLNTYWLARSTATFARRAVQSADPGRESRRPGAAGILFQYVLRYGLIGIAAYAILKSSVFSILGFFAGLFIPVGSLMLEAFYEAWVSYRRGL
jgi:small-conductance mechanosensitive channel